MLNQIISKKEYENILFNTSISISQTQEVKGSHTMEYLSDEAGKVLAYRIITAEGTTYKITERGVMANVKW